jgi:hypothetical protein
MWQGVEVCQFAYLLCLHGRAEPFLRFPRTVATVWVGRSSSGPPFPVMPFRSTSGGWSDRGDGQRLRALFTSVCPRQIDSSCGHNVHLIRRIFGGFSPALRGSQNRRWCCQGVHCGEKEPQRTHDVYISRASDPGSRCIMENL